MMNKLLAVIIAVTLLLSSCSSQPYSAEYKFSDAFFGDTAASIYYSPDFLFRLTADTVYNSSGKPFKVVLPADHKSSNLLWGSVYYTGFKRGRTELFYLVSGTPGGPATVIADKNGNLDFTDDVPEVFDPLQNFYVTAAGSTGDTRFKVLLRLVPDSIRNKMEASFKKAGVMPRHAAPIAALVQEIRCNVKQLLLPDSNQLAIEDYDCNGRYNDSRDIIYAYDPFSKGKYSHKQSSPVKKGWLLPYKNTSYKLIDIDKYGRHISLAQLDTVVDITDYFPDIALTDTNGATAAYRQLLKPREYTVLYFWGTWCKGCTEQTDSVNHFYRQYKKQINFYTINYGDKPETVRKYVAKKGTEYPVYFISQKQLGVARVQGFPTFYIINNKGVLTATTSHYSDVKQILGLR